MGSEMCIRDRCHCIHKISKYAEDVNKLLYENCVTLLAMLLNYLLFKYNQCKESILSEGEYLW